jgi:NhaA family Na+:H+ antiporter
MADVQRPQHRTMPGVTIELPTERIDRVVHPIKRFLGVQSASAGLLLVSTIAALLVTNSHLGADVHTFWETPVRVSWGTHEVANSLRHWINEGLMVVFFFVVGLELKREFALGHLNSLRAALLPIAAAMGGMVVPAGVYLLFQWGEPGQKGWGIPMATDIAFMVGCLTLLGNRVPNTLRVLLLSLAVTDDLGAVMVIALGYSHGINIASLLLGFGGIGVMMVTAWLGARSVPIYVIQGILIWFAFHESGIHATIAGVIIGLLTPVYPWISEGLLAQLIRRLEFFLTHGFLRDPEYKRAMVKKLERAARESISPLERLEVALQPWVAFLIIPLFAFANAGVTLTTAAFSDSITIAIIFGLVFGKPLGVVLGSAICVRLGLARLPDGVTWRTLTYSSLLTGIGFTMSLFIADLALQGPALDAAKVGVLTASTVCAVSGLALLAASKPSDRPEGSSYLEESGITPAT